MANDDDDYDVDDAIDNVINKCKYMCGRGLASESGKHMFCYNKV